VQCLEVQPIVAGYLLYLILLGDRAVSTPFIIVIFAAALMCLSKIPTKDFDEKSLIFKE
jgi:hypothetical protein